MIGFIGCGLGYLSSDQASLLPHLELPVFDDTIPYDTIPYPDSAAQSLSRRNGTRLGCLGANAEMNKNLEETRGRRSTGKRQRVRMVDESSGRGQEKKSLLTRLSIGAGCQRAGSIISTLRRSSTTFRYGFVAPIHTSCSMSCVYILSHLQTRPSPKTHTLINGASACSVPKTFSSFPPPTPAPTPNETLILS